MLPHDLRNPFVQNPWKRFSNGSGETIPPFSVMRITGATNNHGEITFTVAKPNATTYTAYLVSGPFAVPAGKEGICTTLTQAGYVAYDTGETPSVGEEWGPTNGQWTVIQGATGFFICGGAKLTAGVNVVAAIQISSGGDTVDTVQVYHEGGTAREIVEANASNVHPGRIKRFSGTMSTHDDIWIGFTDNFDVWGGNVLAVQGEYYGPGKQNGTFTVGEDERPLYLVTHGERHWDAFAYEEIAAGTATEVEFLEWDAGDAKFNPTGLRWDAQDFFLNSGETVEVGTKLQVKWQGPRLVITGMYCSPSDDEDIVAIVDP